MVSFCPHGARGAEEAAFTVASRCPRGPRLRVATERVIVRRTPNGCPVTHAVFFDLDGTLFDRDVAVRSLSETQYAAFERELTGVSREPFVSRVLELDAHGSVDKEMVYKRLVLEFDLPEALAPRLVEDFWGRYHQFCRPFPDALNTLKALRARGKAVGVITNGRQTIQNGTIDALRIRPLLDAILISETEGVRGGHDWA